MFIFRRLVLPILFSILTTSIYATQEDPVLILHQPSDTTIRSVNSRFAQPLLNIHDISIEEEGPNNSFCSASSSPEPTTISPKKRVILFPEKTSILELLKEYNFNKFHSDYGIGNKCNQKMNYQSFFDLIQTILRGEQKKILFEPLTPKNSKRNREIFLAKKQLFDQIMTLAINLLSLDAEVQTLFIQEGILRLKNNTFTELTLRTFDR